MEKETAQRRGTRTDIQANLPGSQFGQTRDKAGALVNVSPRSVTSASKVLDHGCDRLIALVDAGELAVPAAARLASLGHENQEKAVARGARHDVIKARKLRGAPKKAGPFTPSQGRFGVLRVEAPEGNESAGVDGVVFLWVAAGGRAAAIEALKAHGFQSTVASPIR